MPMLSLRLPLCAPPARQRALTPVHHTVGLTSNPGGNGSPSPGAVCSWVTRAMSGPSSIHFCMRSTLGLGPARNASTAPSRRFAHPAAQAQGARHVGAGGAVADALHAALYGDDHTKGLGHRRFPRVRALLGKR